MAMVLCPVAILRLLIVNMIPRDKINTINMPLTDYGYVLNINRKDEDFIKLRCFIQESPVEKMSFPNSPEGYFSSSNSA